MCVMWCKKTKRKEENDENIHLTEMPVKLFLSRTASGRRRRPRRGSANICWSLRAASCHRWCTPTQRLRKVTEKKREQKYKTPTYRYLTLRGRIFTWWLRIIIVYLRILKFLNIQKVNSCFLKKESKRECSD